MLLIMVHPPVPPAPAPPSDPHPPTQNGGIHLAQNRTIRLQGGGIDSVCNVPIS